MEPQPLQRPADPPGVAAPPPHDLRTLTTVLTGLVLASVAVPMLSLVLFGRVHVPIGHGTSPLMSAVAGGVAVLGVTWVAAAITWMGLARSNAQRIQPGGSWGVGWAVGAWFVPLGYLVLGYLVMRDIWTGTHRGESSAPRAPGWVLAGWLLWAVPKAVGHLIGFSQGQYVPLGLPGYPVLAGMTAAQGMAMQVGWVALDMVAAVFFIRFIHAVAHARPDPLPELPATAHDAA